MTLTRISKRLGAIFFASGSRNNPSSESFFNFSKKAFCTAADCSVRNSDACGVKCSCLFMARIISQLIWGSQWCVAWNIPTFGKSCRALGKARRVFAEFRRFCGHAYCTSGCVYPVRSSSSICKSPRSSRGQFHPRHFPWRTKSHLRPSAIA